jgi:hypothetical protein
MNHIVVRVSAVPTQKTNLWLYIEFLFDQMRVIRSYMFWNTLYSTALVFFFLSETGSMWAGCRKRDRCGRVSNP